jgi:carboxyl-terminal processing protease
MKSRAFLVIAGILGAVILLVGACSAGFVAGRVLFPSASSQVLNSPGFPDISDLQIGPGSGNQGGTPEDLSKLFEPFWQTWELVHDQYVDQPVDDEAMMRGAIKGMLESLGDQHTSYLDPTHAERMNAQLNGDEYEGIGAWVDVSSDYLTIISPMPGSPAEKAGLKSGDKVIAIDGEDMTGIDGELVRQRVLGPKGSIVTLSILRESSQEHFDVDVKRDSIVVPTVEGRMLDNNVAYIHLYTFGAQTDADLRSTLNDLLAQKPVGLVLDLRNNGGGYLDTAISVVSEFIDDGVVMYEEYGDGTRTTYNAKPGGEATQIPMVVLINEGSASASEIVAGAIQDRGRGQLVGVTSFGKGSVQTVVPLVNNEGQARVTIARWLTPDGTSIHGVGLTPNFEVQITEEDSQANRDPQLDKAVELLLQTN